MHYAYGARSEHTSSTCLAYLHLSTERTSSTCLTYLHLEQIHGPTTLNNISKMITDNFCNRISKEKHFLSRCSTKVVRPIKQLGSDV